MQQIETKLIHFLSDPCPTVGIIHLGLLLGKVSRENVCSVYTQKFKFNTIPYSLYHFIYEMKTIGRRIYCKKVFDCRTVFQIKS